MAPLTKLQSQRIHAKRRIEQRFGIQINRHDIREIVNLIQTNRAKFIEKQSNSRSLFSLVFKDNLLYVIYDKTRKNICTFLTEEMIKERRNYVYGWYLLF